MKISIRKPLSYTHIGHKDNQEDRIFPLADKVNTTNRFFILCDGMGGHENGEVASETVCETLGRYFENHIPEAGIVTNDFFNEGLAAAYDALDKKDNGALRKMGTTLVFIYLHRQGCLVAHIGDSRIYQIRPGKGLIYQSSDHSLVNELLKIGEITPEEAENHPQKNVITRVMQPNLERRYKAEIHQLNDLKAGDYFFLCSDGVLEQLTNEKLCSVLSDKTLSDAGKLKTLEAIGEDVTKDNYTAYFIPIDDVTLENGEENQTEYSGLVMATLTEEDAKGNEDIVAEEVKLDAMQSEQSKMGAYNTPNQSFLVSFFNLLQMKSIKRIAIVFFIVFVILILGLLVRTQHEYFYQLLHWWIDKPFG